MFSSELNKELKGLYKKFPDIKRYLSTMSCDSVMAEDIFQEALLIYARKRKQEDFVLTVEPFFFVKSTCRLLWMNEARKIQKSATDSLEIDVQQIDDDWMAKELKLANIEKKLAEIGEQCKELLLMFYAKGMNMFEIAEKIGLRNDKVAKAQKYRCIQKLKDKVTEDMHVLESNLLG